MISGEKATSPAYVIQLPGGGWRLAGSRISLDSVVHAYRDGETPEQIVLVFPSLSLEQVYGAIAFYLHHQSQIDQYLQQQAELWDRLEKEAKQRNASLRERVLKQYEQIVQKKSAP